MYLIPKLKDFNKVYKKTAYNKKTSKYFWFNNLKNYLSRTWIKPIKENYSKLKINYKNKNKFFINKFSHQSPIGKIPMDIDLIHKLTNGSLIKIPISCKCSFKKIN